MPVVRKEEILAGLGEADGVAELDDLALRNSEVGAVRLRRGRHLRHQLTQRALRRPLVAEDGLVNRVHLSARRAKVADDAHVVKRLEDALRRVLNVDHLCHQRHPLHVRPRDVALQQRVDLRRGGRNRARPSPTRRSRGGGVCRVHRLHRHWAELKQAGELLALGLADGDLVELR